MAKTRIQKALSEAGVASRRAVEEMIGEGRITVNGQLVIELPCFVDPAADKVHVDGAVVRLAGAGAPRRYLLLNKPKHVVCTSRDPQGRKRAVDCIPTLSDRVYCVGRLDADSTGLILLTNDGDLTQHLTHPKFGVVKTYRVQIAGRLTAEQVQRFKQGVWLDGRRTSGAMIRVLRSHATGSLIEVKLTEGRNREIRRVLARLGQKVRRLHRCAIGPITDRGLGVGSWRELSAREVGQLREAGGFASAKRPGPPPGKPTRTTGQRAKDAARPTRKPKPKPRASAARAARGRRKPTRRRRSS